MRNTKLLLCCLAVLGLAAGNSVHAEKIKMLRFKQDDAQQKFVSKVYELKHIKAGDITPFILGAVTRYNTNSKVSRLKYKFGKKQFLVVSTPPAMMKHVDAMIKKLDRPCKVKDAFGSVISGTGIYRFAYLPKHRSTSDMLTILNKAVKSGDGEVFRDATSNLLYWKDSLSDGKTVMKWAKKLDRPTPQVELQFKVYEVRKSVLNDLGLDYLAWKNGPGLNMFQIGLESIALESVENFLANMDQFAAFGGYGGMFFAPQIDLSFVRALSQQGAAKITSTGTLTVVNDYAKTFYVKFSPQLQNIEKDEDDKTSVETGASAEFEVKVSKPVVCFKDTGEKDESYNGDAFDYTTYSRLGGTVQFGYDVIMNDVVERNNRGDELTESSTVQSNLTVELGVEHLMAIYGKKQKVEQVVGIPFLCDIPILKYLFSTTTTTDEDVKMFVTVKARLVHPNDNYAAWSGKLLTEGDFK